MSYKQQAPLEKGEREREREKNEIFGVGEEGGKGGCKYKVFALGLVFSYRARLT